MPFSRALIFCYCHSQCVMCGINMMNNFGAGSAGVATRATMAAIVPYLRRWDVRTCDRVHYLLPIPIMSRNVSPESTIAHLM